MDVDPPVRLTRTRLIIQIFSPLTQKDIPTSGEDCEVTSPRGVSLFSLLGKSLGSSLSRATSVTVDYDTNNRLSGISASVTVVVAFAAKLLVSAPEER